MESMVVSPEKEWYTGEGSTQIDYERSVEKGEWDPFVVLHTSGSSGFPKPIICRQGWLTTMDSFGKVPPVNGVHSMHISMISSVPVLLLLIFRTKEPNTDFSSLSVDCGIRP